MTEISSSSLLVNKSEIHDRKKNIEENIKNNSLCNKLISIVSSPIIDINRVKVFFSSGHANVITLLKKCHLVKNTQAPTIDIELASAHHTLLQQVENVSAELQERLDPPVTLPFRLKGKTGLLIGTGILAGSAAGTLAYHSYSTKNANTTAHSSTLTQPEMHNSLAEMEYGTNEIGYYEYPRPELHSASLTNDPYNHYEHDRRIYKRKIGLIDFLKKNIFWMKILNSIKLKNS